MIEYCKLQIGCMLIVLYVGFIYYRERYAYKVKQRDLTFELLLYVGMAGIIFDALTAYTVNHLETIPAAVNATLHACFLCSLDAIVFLIFIYVLDLTKGITRDNRVGAMLALPFFVNMHDIGKIAIPDAILQKPGKLTDEEFQVMKTHSEKGGEIIKETFETMGSGEYGKIAYQVARYHHEKWNGKGYPEGLTRKEIPLCARIMAVADVFDAVSAKRCYRDAMPLDQCFEIIERGSGQDFDPFIAEVFLELREEVGQVVENSKKVENRAL